LKTVRIVLFWRMPINPKFLAPFREGEFFHVYNRTNGSHKLFREEKNYRYFIESFEDYLVGVSDIYSYCLLPSHFHYIIRIKQLNQMETFLESIKSNMTDVNKIVANQFKCFLTSYTMAFNKLYDRQGSLFNHRFRRVALESESSVKDCIFYVHSNPAHHQLTNNFIDYKWSSYSSILSGEPTKIKRQEVLELFGGRGKFIKFHQDHKPVIGENKEFRPF
jgi:putative transposase